MLRDTVGKVDTRFVAAFFNPSALRAPPLSHIRAQRRREEYPVRLRDTAGRRENTHKASERLKAVQEDTYNTLPLLIVDEIGGVPARTEGLKTTSY